MSGLACGGGAPSGTPTPSLTVEQIRDQAIAVGNDLDTCQFEMDMTMEMSVTMPGVTMESTVTMDSNGAIDEANGRMNLDMEMRMELPGEAPQQVQMEMYMVDDYVYMKVVAPGAPQGWMKFAMPEGYWVEYDIASQQLDILLDVEVELLGTDTVDGTECYVLELTASLEKLWAMMQMGGAAEQLPPGLDLEQVVTDFSVRQWIAKDTFFTRKADIGMTMVLTPESLGVPPEQAEDFDGTANIAMTFLMHHINQPVTITLPPGAEEAEEVPVPG